MSYTGDAIEPASDHLIAWVGHMTKAELADYLAEPGGLAGLPHSIIMAEVGSFYDHDFIWAQASDKPTRLRDLAKMNGIQDEDLIAEMESRCEECESISAFIILWNYRLRKDFTQRFARGKLKWHRFLGAHVADFG